MAGDPQIRPPHAAANLTLLAFLTYAALTALTFVEGAAIAAGVAAVQAQARAVADRRYCKATTGAHPAMSMSSPMALFRNGGGS